jgi:hypothetical protein
MTQDEIIELAYKAYENCDHIPNLKIPKEFIESFAKLVVEREREACAKVCEEYDNGRHANAADLCAEAIRARGQA